MSVRRTRLRAAKVVIMKSSIPLLAAALFLVASPVLAGDVPPAGAQTATKDAELAAYLKELGPQVSKQDDAAAKAAIQKLLGYWKDKDVSEAAKKPIPDLLEKYGRSDAPATAVEGIAALGELGPAGAPPTLSLLDRALKEKTPDAETYRACFMALRKLADPKPATIKAIEEAMRFRVDDVVGHAFNAVSGYKDAPGKVRKELLEESVKQAESVFNNANGKNSAAIAKWTAIKSYAMSALNALSGQTFKDPAEARAWFNDHKGDKSWNG
jgi:hypothetical protein